MQLTKSLLTFTAYFQNVFLTLSLHSGIRKWSNKLICFSKYANNGFSLLSIEYPRKSSSRSSSSVSLKKEFIYSRERNDASNAVINSFINGYLAKYNGSKNAFHQNQERCRDGALRVAAWRNQPVENVRNKERMASHCNNAGQHLPAS